MEEVVQIMDDEADKTARDGDLLQTLMRGLSVIACFDRLSPRMTPTEVARRTNLTRAAARRILLTLVHTGHATTDGKTFELTARVLELGYAYLSSFGLPEIARSTMESVAREVGEACSLGVLNQADIVYIGRVEPPRLSARPTAGIGLRLPAHAMAMGQVMLAALADDELDALLGAWPPQALTEYTITSRDALLARIDQVRQQGYSFQDQEFELGSRSIAVPVRDRRNRVIAALAVGASIGRCSVEDMVDRILPVLRRAAREIERPAGLL